MTKTLKTAPLLAAPIGTTANLLSGLNTSWSPLHSSFAVTKPLTKTALSTVPVEPSTELGAWENLTVSLHQSVSSLLSDVLSVDVYYPAATDGGAPVLPTGALFPKTDSEEGSNSELSGLDEALGVPLDNDHCYAVARINRLDVVREHPARVGEVLLAQSATVRRSGLVADPDFVEDMQALPRVKDSPSILHTLDVLTAEDLDKYAALFNKWGTHYVSRATVGDSILQVFAYPRERFPRVLAGVRNKTFLTGFLASAFVRFTSDANKGRFGFVSDYGVPFTLSNDKAFNDSVAAGVWKDDTFSEGQNSLFKVYYPPSNVQLPPPTIDGPPGQVSPPQLIGVSQLTSSAITSVSLSPLEQFCEYQRAEVWLRAFKICAATVFRNKVRTPMLVNDERDFADIVVDDQPGVASSLPTQSINVYKARLDLSDVKILFPDIVQSFAACGYVVALRGMQQQLLPGSSVNILAGIVDARANENATGNEESDADEKNSIVVSPDSFDSFSLLCSKFLGFTFIEKSEESGPSSYFAIADGFVVVPARSSGEKVSFTKKVTAASVVDESKLDIFRNSLEFALVYGDAVLGSQQPKARFGSIDPPAEPLLNDVVRELLHWLPSIISASSNDFELLQMRSRAALLAAFRPDGNRGAFVPILESSSYAPQLESMLNLVEVIERDIAETNEAMQQRLQQEQLLNSLDQLNDNILQTGKLLVGSVEQSAAHQQDVASFYGQVIEELKREELGQEDRIRDIQFELSKAQDVLEIAGEKFQKELKSFATLQFISAGISIALAIFAVGTPITADITDDIKQFGTIGANIKRMMEILEKMNDVYSSSQSLNAAKLAQAGVDDIAGGSFGDVSSIPFEELQISFDQMMSSLPFDDRLRAPRADFEAAFKRMMLVAKRLASARSQLYSLKGKLYEHQIQEILTQRQVDRLRDLSETFSVSELDDNVLPSIDLIGMTSMISFRHDRIMSELSKAFLIHDQALQYETLQPPTVVASNSLFTYSHAIVEQQQKKTIHRQQLAALQPTITNEIAYTVPGIPVTALTDGQKHQIPIPADSSVFQDFVFVRVKSLILSVSGITSTDSGDYLLRLEFDSAPFVDKDLDGNLMRFNTPSRQRIYNYGIDGSPNFSDHGESWSEQVSDITPFGTWVVDLPPNVASNSGLKFSGPTVSVTFKFVLEARINVLPPIRVGGSRPTSRAIPAINRTTSSLSIPPSKDAVISDIFNVDSAATVWDAVFCMKREKINTALREQFELENDESFNNTANIETVTTSFSGREKLITLSQVKIGVPQFENTSAFPTPIRVPIIGGTLSSREVFGSEETNTEVILSGLTLHGSITAEIDIGQGIITYNFGDGENSFSILEAEDVGNGLTEINSETFDEEMPENVFKKVANYFELNNVRFSISLSGMDAMNSDLEEQYNSNFSTLIDTSPIDVSFSVSEPKKELVTQFDLTYGFPSLQFGVGSDFDVKTSVNIIKGKLSKITRVNGEDEPAVNEISLTDLALEAELKLDKVQGSTEDGEQTLDVKLNMGSQTFRPSSTQLDHEIRLTSDDLVQFASSIKNHFTQQNVVFLINRLNLEGLNVPSFLRPKNFRLRMKKTPSGTEMLQLFIMTTGRIMPEATEAVMHTEVPDPIPIDFDCTLIINRRLLYQTILPNRITTSADSWNVAVIRSGKSMMLKFTDATITTDPVDISQLNSINTTRKDSPPIVTETKKFHKSKTVEWKLGDSNTEKAMKLFSQSNGKFRLEGEKPQTVTFEVRTVVRKTIADQQISLEVKTEDKNFDMESEVSAEMVLKILDPDDANRDQRVAGSVDQQNVRANALPGAGVCTGTGAGVLRRISQKVADVVPPAVENQLSIDVNDISLFALKNLLFYKNVINLKTVAAPGDAVIFGEFTRTD